MVEKPADDAVIKLEINYAVASEQALLNHDFKLPKASNENIRKKVITLQRKGQQGLLKPKSIQDTLAEEVVKYKLTNMSTHLHSE